MRENFLVDMIQGRWETFIRKLPIRSFVGVHNDYSLGGGNSNIFGMFNPTLGK